MNKNYSQQEIDKFSKYEKKWWDKNGVAALLHKLNPLRTQYIINNTKYLNTQAHALDVGCGGGILTESLAEHDIIITGIDACESAITAAVQHSSNNNISYKKCLIEELKPEEKQYDFITCLEMLEHVPHPEKIIAKCSELIKKDGIIFFSTINRNPKSYLFSIIGAEYLLNLLPKGTHDYQKFIKPSELNHWAKQNQLKLIDITGIKYNPCNQKFSLDKDVSVNYICCFKKY